MLGGTDWQLTALYCQGMNEMVRQRLGDRHSAKMLIHTPDAVELASLQEKGHWREIGRLLEEASGQLVAAGAGFLMICSNSLHIVAEQLSAAVSVPFLHIGEAIGQRLHQDGIRRAGMLGTAFAPEQAFLRQSLADSFDIDLLLPDTGASLAIHNLISRGETDLTPEAADKLSVIFNAFRDHGAKAILLGGRRIGRLVRQSTCPLPMYDTVSLHIEAAVRLALA